MINPLVESCVEITRCGYENRRQMTLPYQNKDLARLTSFLLNHGKEVADHYIKREVDDRARIALSFGGGIDSYCALMEALKKKQKVTVVYTNYGQPYSKYERAVFTDLSVAYSQVQSDLRSPDLLSKMQEAFFNDMMLFQPKRDQLRFVVEEIPLMTTQDAVEIGWKNYIIPARNLALAAVASQYGDTVWIVATSRTDETVGAPDKTAKFYKLATRVFTDFYGRSVKVESPFITRSKEAVVREYVRRGGQLFTLSNYTFSCYTPARNSDIIQCGSCYSCYKKFKLFQALDWEVKFAAHPQTGPNFQQYQEREAAKRSEE